MATMTPKFPDVHVELTGHDGNAFAIIARCKMAAKRAGIPSDTIMDFMAEATSGDYDHLLRVAMTWFDCC